MLDTAAMSVARSLAFLRWGMGHCLEAHDGGSGATSELISGIVSGQNEVHGWNAAIQPALNHLDVVRSSDTVVTITLPACLLPPPLFFF